MHFLRGIKGLLLSIFYCLDFSLKEPIYIHYCEIMGHLACNGQDIKEKISLVFFFVFYPYSLRRTTCCSLAATFLIVRTSPSRACIASLPSDIGRSWFCYWFLYRRLWLVKTCTCNSLHISSLLVLWASVLHDVSRKSHFSCFHNTCVFATTMSHTVTFHLDLCGRRDQHGYSSSCEEIWVDQRNVSLPNKSNRKYIGSCLVVIPDAIGKGRDRHGLCKLECNPSGLVCWRYQQFAPQFITHGRSR